MSVTQYVGARYVPLFANPIDWDITKAYEPLTIVYYQGNSYTSKQSVPTGTDINNETYWALTGNYNAQIEQYRAEVVAAKTGADTANATNTTQDAQLAGTSDSGLKTLVNAETTRATEAESKNASDIATNTASITAESTARTTADTAESTARTTADTALSDRITTNNVITTQVAANNYFGNILLIGDSYMQGAALGDNGAPQQLDSFGTIVQNWFNNNTNRHIYMTCEGGYSFVNGNWTNLLTTFADTLTNVEKNSISDVYVCGGANDRITDSINFNTIKNAIGNFCTTLASTLPYAKLHVVFIGACCSGLATYNTNTTQAALNGALQAYQVCGRFYGYSFVNASGVIKYNKYLSHDYFHPNQNGQYELANTLFNIINGAAPTTWGYDVNECITAFDYSADYNTYNPNNPSFCTKGASVSGSHFALAFSNSNPYYAGEYAWRTLQLTYIRCIFTLTYPNEWIPGSVIFDLGEYIPDAALQIQNHVYKVFNVPMIGGHTDSSINKDVYHQFMTYIILNKNHVQLMPFIGNPWESDNFNSEYFMGTLKNVQAVYDFRQLPTSSDKF